MNERPRLRLNPRQATPQPDYEPPDERPRPGLRPQGPPGPGRGPRPLLRTGFARRLTPFRIAIAVALVGSTGFIIAGLINRAANQIPSLSARLAVFGLTMVAIAVACVLTVIRSARRGDDSNAFWAALAGGFAGLAASGSLAAAIILALVWSSAKGG